MEKVIIYIKKIFYYTPYLLPVLVKIKNPIDFFIGYFKNDTFTVHLRSGMDLRTEGIDDVISVSAIVIKNEYGSKFDDKDEGMIIVDIGANKGYFSIYAATNINNKIFSYEPIVSTFEKFKDNIAINNNTNISPYNFGVAGKKSLREFNTSSDKTITSSMVFTSGGEVEKVQCITLADVFIDNGLHYIDLLKVDCEGAEFEILYTTEAEFLSKIGLIRMEYHNFVEEESSAINNIKM